MARSSMFASLRRALSVVQVARRTGRTPAEVLAEVAARRAAATGPSRRQFLGGTLAATALLPLAACGDNDGPAVVEVAIIGGGVAGLHCAYRLADNGIEPVVFESSDRTGGRMFSAQDLFQDGQVCELGGELIDTGHTVMRGLADDFGLTLDDLPVATAGLRAETYFFDGAVVPDQTLVDAFTPVAALMESAVIAAEADDDLFATVDAMSIPQWLEDEAGLADGSLIRRILESAYTGEYGLQPEEQSIFNLLYLIDYETADPFHIFGDSDERFHIREGNEAIPIALAGAIGADRIRLGHALTRVAARPDGNFTLEFGNGNTVIAEHVVFALPFTRLRQVDLDDAGLPAEKRQVIDEVGYGTNAKLMLGFESRPWADPNGASGSSASDVGELQTTWDTSRGQPGASGILTNFVGGDRGVAMGAGEPEQRATEALPWIDTVFPGSAAEYTAGSAVRMHWPTHPHTLGSYGCYRPGQWAFYGTEGTRVGNLHFCGEMTSLESQGYMEGGAETGLLVAMEIMDDLGVAANRRARELAAPKLVLPQATYHAHRFGGETRRLRRNQRRRLAR